MRALLHRRRRSTTAWLAAFTGSCGMLGLCHAMLGCDIGATWPPLTRDVTLAEYSRDGDGALVVEIDRDGRVQGLLMPWNIYPGEYESATSCPSLHVHATLNGVEFPTAPGSGRPIGHGPLGLLKCEPPSFAGSSTFDSGALEVRVWDDTATWVMRVDTAVPNGELVNGPSVHVGSWATVELDPVPPFEASLLYSSDAGAGRFAFDTNKSGDECETSYVITDDGGTSADAGVPCPLVIGDGGVSFFVPNAPGSGMLYINGWPEWTVTDCEGTGQCSFGRGYGYEPPSVNVPIEILP